MSDFGDFNTPSEDPTADFLARERAALGEDADFFNNDTDLISTSNDLTSPVNLASAASLPTSPAIFESPQIHHQTTDIGFPAQPDNSFTTFETNYPKAEELETSQAFHKALLPEEEPETVRQWREKQAEIIAQRDAEAEAKKEEKIKHAREEIDKFYEDYNDKKQKAIEENREREEVHQKSIEQVASSGNIWERVVKEVDATNAKTGYHSHDVSRMKELMVDLKRDSKAPGNIIEA
ncbi:Clathrin light chain [Choanephora cucurbitarum]|uniref:Clathrin light chain n=1 Tax=Choanephora cucurbitarum TaxID=101091 RepID=A0A1C7NAM8_9FUNG|nr:Clathrin light chain [Choanephora cucurbitarum]